MRLTYELLDEDMAVYARWYLDQDPSWAKPALRTRIVMGLIALLGIFLAATGRGGVGVVVSCAGLGGLLSIPGKTTRVRRLAAALLRANARGTAPESPGHRAVELGEEGLYVESPRGEARLAFEYLGAIEHYGETTLVNMGSSTALVIPHRDLDTQQRLGFEEALGARIREARERGPSNSDGPQADLAGAEGATHAP